MEIVAKVAVIRQQGIGQGQPALSCTHQGHAAHFLQPGVAQGPPQPALNLLGRLQPPRFKGIWQVASKGVVAHQPGHFLNQIHFPQEIHRARRRHHNQPAVVVRLEAATQGLQGLFDPAIVEVGQLAVDEHGAQQIVQGVPAQNQGLRCGLGPAMDPAGYGLGAAELLQQGHGLVGGGEGGFRGQTLFKSATCLRAETQAAGGLTHGLGSEHRCFQPDPLGASGDRLGQAADHARQGDGLVAIGDHEGIGR